MLHSGAAARIRPAESGHPGQQGLVRTDRSDSKVTNLRKNRKIHRTKRGTFFSIKLSPGQNAGERNKTTRPSQQTRELFPSSPPLRSSPRHPIRSHPIAVRTHARARVRAFSRFSIIIFTVHLHPYSTQNVTIRGELFAFVRSSASSPEKSNRLIDFSAAKPLRFGGSTGVNFCIFPSSPESSPVSH